MTELLTVRGVHKSFGTHRVLAVNNLALGRGECALLRGDNGSGKTTLLKILAGLLPADGTEAWFFNGVRCRPTRHGIGGVVYLHQTPYMLAGSVRSNVHFAARCAGAAAARGDEALHWAGLAAQSGVLAHHLSGGMQRRLALARVWAAQPLLCLLDEPTAHLDDQGVALAHELVAALKYRGGSAIVAAHHGEDFCADVEWFLHNGEVRAAAQ